MLRGVCSNILSSEARARCLLQKGSDNYVQYHQYFGRVEAARRAVAAAGPAADRFIYRYWRYCR